MSVAEVKLTAIAAQLKKGVAPQRETVRAFLLWFNAERRGFRVVKRIRNTLKRHGIATSPDFEYTWLDGSIAFVAAPTNSDASVFIEGTAVADPTFRIGRLDAANKSPTTVKPDATLQQAVTIMFTNDFSQLPVMTGPRDVKGVVSWKTIGSRLALRRPCTVVSDCMEPAQVILIDDSLLETISKIASHDYVLIQARDRTISGIVTASDFSKSRRAISTCRRN